MFLPIKVLIGECPKKDKMNWLTVASLRRCSSNDASADTDVSFLAVFCFFPLISWVFQPLSCSSSVSSDALFTITSFVRCLDTEASSRAWSSESANMICLVVGLDRNFRCFLVDVEGPVMIPASRRISNSASSSPSSVSSSSFTEVGLTRSARALR